MNSNPSPATESEHWLDNYPVLTDALAAQDEDVTVDDAADLLADIARTMVPASNNLHYVERCAFGIYLDEYIAPTPVPAF